MQFDAIGNTQSLWQGARSDEKAVRLRLLVPAYFKPHGSGSAEWAGLIAAGSRVPIVAIVNPKSGPGRRAVRAYANTIDRARRAGIKTIGYISTRYGKRSKSTVEAEIDRWSRFYPGIEGIFLDEQSPGREKIRHYSDLTDTIRHKIPQALVVTNPGISCEKEYLEKPAADIAGLFENGFGFETYQLPAWTLDYHPSCFAAFVHSLSGVQEMRQAARRAVQHRIGYLYVTDAGGANPWNRLPEYWDEEVEWVHRINHGEEG